MKSIAGYVFFNGDATISWSSVKESVVALSSYESEYIAIFEVTCQVAWLEMLFIKVEVVQQPKLYVDNKSTIDLANHSTSHGISKHIETIFHFLCEQANKTKLEVVYCESEIQFVDVFTIGVGTLKEFCSIE